MRPSIRQLEYLSALAQTLNFGKAAKLCFVSQPALSKQIQELESLLGVTLFERDKRRVLLTPIGRDVVARANVTLSKIDEVVDTAQSKGAPLSSSLKIGVIPTIAPYLLPHMVPGLCKAYPKCRLLLVEDQTDHLLSRLIDGELDLLILALEVDLGSVSTLPLFKDEFSFVVPASHALAKRRSVPVPEIAEEAILLLEDGHCLRDQALDVCRTANASEVGDFRASSLSTLTQMVAHGVGVTILPKMALESELSRAPSLVSIPFTRPRPYRTIGLAWRPSSPREAEFRLVADFAKM